MITANLGNCEWLVRDLASSNLVERGRLEQIVDSFFRKSPRAEPAQLADFLVDQNVLTRFQADCLLQGKKDNLVVGPFLLTDMIGFGSMGTVYKGQSRVDKQWYAVKVLPSRGVLKLRNAKQIARDFKLVSHPAVVPFTDAGAGGSSNYLAWPYVEGGLTLQKLVEQRGRIPPGLAAHYMHQVAEGMAVCHEKGLTHCLLKPQNLLVKADHSVKIVDLGIGTLLGQEESVIHTGGLANLAASAECAAPETAIDPTMASPAVDQYSLGCCLYFCLTGEYPFVADDYVTKMMMHATQQPPPVLEKAPDVPAGLLAVLERMMAKKPEDRYGSMFDVAAELRPFAKVEAKPAFQSPGPKAEQPQPKRAQPPERAPAPAKKDEPPLPTFPEPSPDFRPPWAQTAGEVQAQAPKLRPDNSSAAAQKFGITAPWLVLIVIASMGLGAAIVYFLKVF
jgi:serine/threonine protein kinase